VHWKVPYIYFLCIKGGFSVSESEESDSVTAPPLTQPPTTNSAQFMHADAKQSQNTSDQTHPSTIFTKVSHSLSSKAAGHSVQQDALQKEGTFEEETMMMIHLLISHIKVLLHLVQQHIIEQLKIAETAV